jgi:uncharacterized membrane protein
MYQSLYGWAGEIINHFGMIAVVSISISISLLNSLFTCTRVLAEGVLVIMNLSRTFRMS